MLLHLFFVAAMFSAGAFAAEDPNMPLIDFADRVMQSRECADCPGFIGQMMGANPITLGQIASKADIVVEDCHFTLVGPDLVRTASHCVRRWTREWSTKAGGDCAKAYRFYFPKTPDHPYETANCKKIESPISLKSGLLQMEPDDVLIRLDRTVARGAYAETETRAVTAEDILQVWGFDGEKIAKRTCRRVEKSLLTPLDHKPGSAYATLTCDGELGTGWSGGGIFAGGKHIAVISFGLGNTTYGISYFGENEVAVSQNSCSLSATESIAPECLATAAQLDLAIHDRYASAIDLAGDWHDSTLAMIQTRIPYAEFEYGHGPASSPLFSFTPRYTVKCYHRDLLPTEGKILTGVDFNLDTFLPRFVVWARDTSVAGVSRRGTGPGQGPTEFNIGLVFQWSEIRENLIPDCDR